MFNVQNIPAILLSNDMEYILCVIDSVARVVLFLACYRVATLRASYAMLGKRMLTYTSGSDIVFNPVSRLSAI